MSTSTQVEKYSGGAMVAMCIGSIFIPLIGIIAGASAMGSGSEAKKGQGGLLLLFGIGSAAFWFWKLFLQPAPVDYPY